MPGFGSAAAIYLGVDVDAAYAANSGLPDLTP